MRNLTGFTWRKDIRSLENERERYKKWCEEALAIAVTKDANISIKADKVVSACCEFSAPRYSPKTYRRLIRVLRGGRGKAVSRKTGNVILDLGKIIEAMSSAILTIVGAANLNPMLLPPAFFFAWRVMSNCFDVQISETDTVVYYVMWMHQNESIVSEKGLLEAANSHLTKYERRKLKQGDISSSLARLEEIGAIKKHVIEGGWKLVEKIQIIYR